MILTNALFAQNDCFQSFYQKGIAAIKAEDFETAINNFKAAKVCPDKPSANDVDDKIFEAQNGYINAIQKERKRAQSLALTAKSILELQKNDNATTAFRYAQYALEKDDNSESRAAFYEAVYQIESEESRLLYSKSFKPVREINEHIKKVEYSPDGNYIIVLSSNKKVLIFDLDGNLITSKQSYFKNTDQFSMSADDASYAYIGRDYFVHIDELNKEGSTEKFSSNQWEEVVESLIFSPGGKYFALGFIDGTTRLFHSDGTFIKAFDGHGQRISSLSFSKDDSLLVTSNNRGVVGIWDIEKNQVDTIVIPKSYDTEVILSSDKKHLLVTSSGRRAFLFTVDGKEVFRTKGYFWNIADGNFSASGEYVALGNNIYSLKKGAEYGKLIHTLPSWVRKIRFSETRDYLLALGNERIAQVWRRQFYEWGFYANLGGHTDDIAFADFSPDGNSVVTASYDLTVKTWSLKTRISQSFSNAGKLLRPISLKDSIYAVSHKTKDIYMWNAVSGYSGFYGLPVEDIITQSTDGKLLLAVEKDMSNIWKFDPSGEGIRYMAGMTAFYNVKHASFSPNKDAVAIYSRDDYFISMSVWDFKNHESRALGGGHGDVNAIAWTIDGKQLLLGNKEGEVIAWNFTSPLKDMEINKSWKAHEGNPISSLATSSDGKLIATASWDNTAKLWNTDYEYLLTLHGHNMEINTVAFSPDNRFIVTASEDRTAKIWDTEGQLIVSLEGYQSDVKQAYFSPDMKYVLTNYGDGMIKIWPFDPVLIEGKIGQFTSIDLDAKEKEKYGIK